MATENIGNITNANHLPSPELYARARKRLRHTLIYLILAKIGKEKN